MLDQAGFQNRVRGGECQTSGCWWHVQGMCRRGEMRQDLQRLEQLFEDVQREKELVSSRLLWGQSPARGGRAGANHLAGHRRSSGMRPVPTPASHAAPSLLLQVVARLALRTPGSLTPAALRRATDPGCRQSVPSPSALKSALRMSENGGGSKFSPQRGGGGGRAGVCRSLDGAVGSAGGGGSAGKPARATPNSRSASGSKELPLSPAGRRSNAARPLFGGGNGAAFSPKKLASGVPFSPNKQLACKSKMGGGAGSDDDVLLGSPVRGVAGCCCAPLCLSLCCVLGGCCCRRLVLLLVAVAVASAAGCRLACCQGRRGAGGDIGPQL